MPNSTTIFAGQELDVILGDLSVLKNHEEISDLVDAYLNDNFETILQGPHAEALCKEVLKRLSTNKPRNFCGKSWYDTGFGEEGIAQALFTGLAAFNAFLQANVTGPPVSGHSPLFNGKLADREISLIKDKCFRSLDVDGLSVYQHIPHIELFCLARGMFTQYFPRVINGRKYDSKWMRIRVNTYHQRLLSLGASNTRLSDWAGKLQTQIEADMLALELEMMKPDSKFSTEAKVELLLEKAHMHIMQGLEGRAGEDIKMAYTASGFTYALSGALGKRTKFQEKETSQLVVFAKSEDEATGTAGVDETSRSSTNRLPASGPAALELNDDTLLESIEFSKLTTADEDDPTLPPALAHLKPDEQPQLKALDQIILLTEATLKDTLAPRDKLSREEVLPYAVRVLTDKPTNWQVYTQALLVRSRIEAHSARTLERSVLQLQAIVDQIIADTANVETNKGGSDGIPQIQVTSFLPRPKPPESAPVAERLKYIYQLNMPTRWEIETELAYAWSSAGSFVSALEIFKRLKLWAEVALCYHSVGQEDKARQIIRRQLYLSSNGPGIDRFDIDAEEVLTEHWDGEIRSPPPPHAPRLWCILGDLDQDPSCWERAWKISNARYARAQRTLGEYYSRKGGFEKAREAYMKATVVNRQNGETWSRLGDIDLRLGNWDGAIIAFQQSIMIDDTDAKTYSNLGSALLSKHADVVETRSGKAGTSPATSHEDNATDNDEETSQANAEEATSPKDLLRQALTAYKRGAAIAHSNWQIWDNVITIAGRMSPPSFPDIVLALRSIIRIRGPTMGEDAIDIDILSALVAEAISRKRIDSTDSQSGHIYIPPRGTLPRAVIDLVNSEIVPLITNLSIIWSLVEKLSLYQRDYTGALTCAEKAWRITTAGDEWLQNAEKWKDAVAATEALVSAYENYGPMDAGAGDDGPHVVEKAWKAKARSAIRGILGKAKDTWEDTAEWRELKAKMDEFGVDRK